MTTDASGSSDSLPAENAASSSGAVDLVVFGGGHMGGALVGGLLAAGWSPQRLLVVEPAAERRRHLTEAHPGLVVAPAVSDGAARGAGAVLAVKPEAVDAACRAAAQAGVARVLSVVAGVATRRLESSLPEGMPAVRAMPNAPALVGASTSVISGGSHVSSADLDWAEGVLESVGTVVRLPERHLDAVTGLSGSGPAYLFLVVEAMIDAGVLCGLSRDVSSKLAVGTFRGVAALLNAEDAANADPVRLRASVTSPAGTTAAGVRALEARAVRAAFIEAVASATERSRQLGHAQG